MRWQAPLILMLHRRYPEDGQLLASINLDEVDLSSPNPQLLSNAQYFKEEGSLPSISPSCPFITSNCPG